MCAWPILALQAMGSNISLANLNDSLFQNKQATLTHQRPKQDAQPQSGRVVQPNLSSHPVFQAIYKGMQQFRIRSMFNPKCHHIEHFHILVHRGALGQGSQLIPSISVFLNNPKLIF